LRSARNEATEQADGTTMNVIKAHALGNDFLLLAERVAPPAGESVALARRLCDRHRGIGADGLIVFSDGPRGARMRLLNADGSYSEVSGNGVRCLAAWLARVRGLKPGEALEIETDAGVKTLELLTHEGQRLTFRAHMGEPEQIQRRTLDVAGSPVVAITLRVGNPQCVVLGEVTVERLQSIAAKLAVHPVFPDGSNVELAAVEAPDRVRILIWERGVGPTDASGTGACAAAVAAIAFGGAARDVQVIAPGGSQRVEWRQGGLYLTGWAEVLCEVRWLT
jgi:diaminopimelate epimerase